MIERSVSDILRKYASWFPVVSVTGPRQSGKSTLVQSVFSDYSYVNLELPGDLEAANADPLGFIRSHPAPLIIDEAQLAPELFNVIQVESDRAGTPGQYILSGSQNFLLRRQITQSLAGRVGILTLPPLSFRELACAGKAPRPTTTSSGVAIRVCTTSRFPQTCITQTTSPPILIATCRAWSTPRTSLCSTRS